MRITALFVTLLFALNLLAQDQPGYYITSDGQRMEGFFKTSNFYDPATLEFKKADEPAYAKLNVDDVAEYGIADDFKFRRYQEQGNQANLPVIFLNVVLEGNATLYSYHGERDDVFYYTVAGKQDTPVRLQFTRVRAAERNAPENNRFRQQLQSDVVCPGTGTSEYSRLQYNKRDLADVFTKYNLCTGASQTIYRNSSAKTGRIHFSLYAGLYNTNYNIDNMGTTYKDANTLSAGLGVEAAYKFPKDFFEAFVKLEFENFSTSIKKDFPQPSGFLSNYFDINTTVINVFVGPRYNIKTGSSGKIFVDAAFGLSVPFGKMTESSVLTEGTVVTNLSRDEHNLDTAICGNFGIGYVYKNKLGIDVRYETNREFFNATNTGYTGSFKRIGLNLRYTFN